MAEPPRFLPEPESPSLGAPGSRLIPSGGGSTLAWSLTEEPPAPHGHLTLPDPHLQLPGQVGRGLMLPTVVSEGPFLSDQEPVAATVQPGWGRDGHVTTWCPSSPVLGPKRDEGPGDDRHESWQEAGHSWGPESSPGSLARCGSPDSSPVSASVKDLASGRGAGTRFP